MMGDQTSEKYSIQDFNIIRVIGKGYMGKVMVVREKKTAQIYAIKSIHKQAILDKREINHTMTERNILTQLCTGQSKCPFLIRIHSIFHDRQNVYYLMDFHGGGDLAGLLGQMIRLPESWTRLYAAQIVVALIELHRMGIVYRDIKPENLLISDSGNIVLTDFGLSKSLEGLLEGTKTFCGTPEYLAPEVIQRQHYGFAVDWWSLGILLYEMLIGMTPFWDENQNKMYLKIMKGQMMEMPLSIGKPAKDLIRGLLQTDPKKRMNDSNILGHPFFENIDWGIVSELSYSSPFIPGLGSKMDVRAFDPIFTSMPPIITPDDNNMHQNSSLKERIFKGFSFKP